MQEKMTYWRWHAKVSRAINGGEYTKFFHMSSSQRLRKNNIFTLTREGSDFTSHQHKAEILRDFFVSLIGTPAHTSWAFDLNAIYPKPVAGLHVLDEKFSEEKIKLSFFQMNPQAIPGPDGFGPSFYRTYWPLLKQAILPFFSQFYQGVGDT